VNRAFSCEDALRLGRVRVTGFVGDACLLGTSSRFRPGFAHELGARAAENETPVEWFRHTSPTAPGEGGEMAARPFTVDDG